MVGGGCNGLDVLDPCFRVSVPNGAMDGFWLLHGFWLLRGSIRVFKGSSDNIW